MADEIEILTENEAGDSWVDPTPSAVSTGYSAQNTNIEALFNGYDKFDVQYSSPNIIINISGIADDNGLPMVVKSQILIDISGQANGTYYLKIIAGSTTLKRSISLVTTAGTWDASKSGFYESGDRILDTIIIKDATGVYLAKRFDNDTKGLKGEFIDTGSGPVKVGQNLRTTDAVTFSTVNTGHGDNELYPMNQDVRSSASPTFADATIASKLLSTYLGYLNQDVKTTASPSFQGLSLPQGTVRGITYEEYTTSSQNTNVTTVMNSMSVGEVRFVALTHTDIGSAETTSSSLYLPATGTYYLVTFGKLSGGDLATQVSAKDGIGKTGTIIIRTA
jgi:hypothetical protein